MVLWNRRSLEFVLTTALLAGCSYAFESPKQQNGGDLEMLLEESKKNLRMKTNRSKRPVSKRDTARRLEKIVSFDHPLETSRQMEQLSESDAKTLKAKPSKNSNGVSTMSSNTVRTPVDHPLHNEPEAPTAEDS